MSWKAFNYYNLLVNNYTNSDHKLKQSCLDDQVGLATISAGVQRAGGTRQHPGSALDEALELRAASIEGGTSGEAIGMGAALPHLSALSPYLSLVCLGVAVAVSVPVSAHLHDMLCCVNHTFRA